MGLNKALPTWFAFCAVAFHPRPTRSCTFGLVSLRFVFIKILRQDILDIRGPVDNKSSACFELIFGISYRKIWIGDRLE